MQPTSSGSRRLRRPLVVLLAISMLAAMLAGPLEPAGADPGGGDAGSSVDPGGQTYTVTLLTGDVVTLHVGADGRQAAWGEPSTDGPAVHVFEQDGQVHAVPHEAAPYVEADLLDDRLFNITHLVEQGYHDVARDDLPLLVAESDEPSTLGAPKGLREVRDLPSIDAVSVEAAKDEIGSLWEAMRDPESEQPGQVPDLTGVERVWLNGKVQATLSESVDQVGAPDAWDLELDGSGVRVAVLDSGYDPSHPDLAGQVVDARNFTEEPDPADATAVDRNGHGTHVAATVAGTGAASNGARAGVAPGAELQIGKVLDAGGAGQEDWVIAGMEWAVDQGAEVVNLSLGEPWPSDGSDPLSMAVDELTERSGALFVVAAGNNGPGTSTVSSPGAATRALTVGAVTKADEPAAYSSRGPRVGDGAVKPEIVAPGHAIVAARASGTSLGNLLDEHYTALNGTSMATPHVAGAAAILRQQYPDWTPDQVKARLASTSATLPDEPVSFQGAGRLDVSAAVGQSVGVSQGVLSFGAVAPDDGTVSRTLTYTNPSDREVRLRLSAEVTRTSFQGPTKPALRVRDSVLQLPPGGEASTEVELVAGRTRPGDYEGRILARDLDDRSVEVRTATAFHMQDTPHAVTVTAVDRHGEPGRGPVELWNLETAEREFGFMADGEVTFEVPAGVYSLATAIETSDGTWPPASETIAGDPELHVRRDTELHFDAREGQPMQVETPRDTTLDSFDVLWHRAAGGRSLTSRLTQGIFGTDLYALPTKAVHTGDFELSTAWQLTEPLLTAQVANERGVRIEPSPWFAGVLSDPYVGEATLPMVYAGTGTPEEFAEVDAEGAAAVATRHGFLSDQAEAAAAAGATLLLVHNDRPGNWRESAWNAPLPVYIISQQAGVQLRDELSRDPAVGLDVAGVRDSTYNYELAFIEPDQVPSGRTYDAAAHPTATVESDYREDSPSMGRREMWVPFVGAAGLGNGMGLRRNGPVQRTEYVSTEDVQWQRFGQPHGEFANMYWTWSGIRQYAPGEVDHQVWWGPLTRPAIPEDAGAPEQGMPVTRVRDAIRIAIPHYVYGGGTRYGWIQEQLGDASELTLRRNGDVVGTSTWSEAQFTVPPGDAEFELDLQVDNGHGNWMATSVGTASTWRFQSARADERPAVLPLVQLDYELDAGPYNDVPAAASPRLFIDPGYQPGATGPGGFTLTVETSYDEGETWQDAPVEAEGGRLRATVPPASEAGFATIRTVATDAAGNELTQRIDRAWRVSAPTTEPAGPGARVEGQ